MSSKYTLKGLADVVWESFLNFSIISNKALFLSFSCSCTNAKTPASELLVELQIERDLFERMEALNTIKCCCVTPWVECGSKIVRFKGSTFTRFTHSKLEYSYCTDENIYQNIHAYAMFIGADI